MGWRRYCTVGRHLAQLRLAARTSLQRLLVYLAGYKQSRANRRTQGQKEQKVGVNPDSQVVPHLSTKESEPCLTSEFG